MSETLQGYSSSRIKVVIPDCPPDALSKARGREVFAADLHPEGLVWAGARRTGVAHGRVVRVDVSAAEDLAGVLTVLTAPDVPGSNLQGIVHTDQPVLCGDKVRYVGDPVALVIAETRDVLRRALELIDVEIEPLPGTFDPILALEPDAPLVHEDRPGGNLLLKAEIVKGDAEAALRDCPVIVRGEFRTPVQEHAFLETQNGTARLLPDGRLEMTVSTQSQFRDRFEIGRALGLDMKSIHIRTPFLGGGFGGKDGATVQCLLALAALNSGGRPVKMQWDREESIQAGYKRHATILRYALGADLEGRLQALVCDLYYDTGAYAHLGVEIMALGMEHAGGPYVIPHTRINGWCVYTNNPVAGAFRGFGVAQVGTAFEGMMDELAVRLGIDPLELRLRNALRPGDVNCSGVAMSASTGMADCLRTLAGHRLWLEREEWKASAPRHVRRGTGLACAFNAMGYGRGLPDAAVAKVELLPDGRFRVYNSVSDMGQGNSGTFANIAAAILGQERSAIELVQPDTEECHPSGSASAGRTTYTFGNALIRACEAMRRKLLNRAAMILLRDDLSGLELAPGEVRHVPTGRSAPLARLAWFLPRDDRISVSEFLMPVVQNPPDTGKAFMLGFPHLFFTFCAQVLRIEADELTGLVRVVEIAAATDGGAVLDRLRYDQQIHGGMGQGLGYALTENLRLDQGRILTPDLSTYLIPTALDAPEMESLAVEANEATGPFGLKGVGEVGMNGPAPAVASALRDAIGLTVREFPVEPEAVLRFLRQERGDAS